MNMIELGAALFALLITPGPTNALLAVAGAQKHHQPLGLLAAVLFAYLATVVPLSLFGAALIGQIPLLHQALSGVAAAWIAFLALGLWRRESGPLATAVTPAQLAVTTLLNPKALVFGLVLIPSGPDVVAGLWLFAALVIVVSLAWLWLGARLAGRYQPLVNRGGAVWLGVLAALLLGRVLAA